MVGMAGQPVTESEGSGTAVGAVLGVAIGHQLRRARQAAGLTRAQVGARIGSGIHPQTLAAYERGVRQCTGVRLIEICIAMGVPAPDIIQWAMQTVQADLPTVGIEVDLRVIIRAKEEIPAPMWTWARTQLGDDPETDIAHLSWAVIQELTELWQIEQSALVRLLLEFTPQPQAQRR